MKTRKFLIGITLLALHTAVLAQSQQLFDFGWQFTPMADGKASNSMLVDLPHDWDIYTAPDPETGATGTGGGWFPGGKGEYRKTFKTPDSEVVKLHFEGVYQKAEVFINGKKAGQHAYGYTPFTVDVTPYLYKGRKQENEVLVKVNNSAQPNCRWYSGSGIYRHVWLQTMPLLHIAENGVFITTREVSADRATMMVDVTVVNESDHDRDAMVVIGSGQMMVHVPAKQTKSVTMSFFVKNPQLWSPDSPRLYDAKVELREAGSLIDQYNVNYGIRTFSYDAEQGFVLNGKPILINGACFQGCL